MVFATVFTTASFPQEAKGKRRASRTSVTCSHAESNSGQLGVGECAPQRTVITTYTIRAAAHRRRGRIRAELWSERPARSGGVQIRGHKASRGNTGQSVSPCAVNRDLLRVNLCTVAYLFPPRLPPLKSRTRTSGARVVCSALLCRSHWESNPDYKNDFLALVVEDCAEGSESCVLTVIRWNHGLGGAQERDRALCISPVFPLAHSSLSKRSLGSKLEHIAIDPSGTVPSVSP